MRIWKDKSISLPPQLLSVRKYLGIVADILYLLMFTAIVIFSFLGKTQFQIPWVEWVQEEDFRSYLIYNFLFHPQTVLLILVVCRYLFSCSFDWRKYAAAFAIYRCASYACTVNGREGVLVYLLLLLGANELPFRRLVQCYFVVIEVLFVVTVAASQLGYVENMIYNFAGRNLRASFGFMYPTVFAAQLFFVVLGIWYFMGEHLNLLLSVLCIFLSGFVYVGCEARFTTACFALLAVILFARGIKIWMRKRAQKPYQVNGLWAGFLTVSPVICALGIHVFSIWYRADVQWMNKLNAVLSNRLSLQQKGVEVYGFRLWGTSIPMVGNGGSTVLPSKYFYLDSSYVQLSLISGMVVFAIVLLLLLTAGCRAKLAGEWTLLWVLAFAGMHGLFEDHLLGISVCPFLLAAFAQLGGHTVRRKGKSNEKRDE